MDLPEPDMPLMSTSRARGWAGVGGLGFAAVCVGVAVTAVDAALDAAVDAVQFCSGIVWFLSGKWLRGCWAGLGVHRVRGDGCVLMTLGLWLGGHYCAAASISAACASEVGDVVSPPSIRAISS